MRIWTLAALGLVGVAAGTVWLVAAMMVRSRAPIRVGILHSKTGPMAISEASMIDAEVLSLEELRDGGGLLGRPLEWVIADGRSDPVVFAREAERLMRDEHVDVIFGCWSSACRKSVKPVVEKENGLLVYPVAYEGMEQSPNIFYTGAAPNQVIIPTVTWSRNALGAKTYYLIGTDTIWPHAVHTIIKDQLKAIGGTVLGEDYLTFGSRDVDAAVEKAVKAKPDVILSTIEGDANLPFYKKIRSAGGEALKIPIISFPVTEDELRDLPAKDMINDYAVVNYFQSIDRPENQAFVKAFKARYGQDRPTSDTIASAYNSVKLWAQAVSDAEGPDAKLVRVTLPRQSLNAPEGVISIDRHSHHTWKPFYVGRIRSDGQVDIIYASTKPIRPMPFPFSRTRDEWDRFLEGIYKGWNGSWQAPAQRKSAGAA
jgi:urea transport system substrate-binding protein